MQARLSPGYPPLQQEEDTHSLFEQPQTSKLGLIPEMSSKEISELCEMLNSHESPETMFNEMLSRMVVAETKGGFQLQNIIFNNLSKEIVRGFDASASSWRNVGRGLNLEGTCTTSDCKAKDMRVWVHKGYHEKFNLSKQVRNCKCPECGKNVNNVNNMGIIDAWFQVEGLLENGNDFKKEFSHLTSKSLKTFDYLSEQSLTSWKYMEISVIDVNGKDREDLKKLIESDTASMNKIKCQIQSLVSKAVSIMKMSDSISLQTLIKLNSLKKEMEQKMEQFKLIGERGTTNISKHNRLCEL